jgi:signal transduction histidine kinase
MGPLYAYSLLPVLSVALLLFFTAALRGRRALGLAAFCLSVALWSTTLLMLCFPETAAAGERLAAVGTFTAATFLHAAYEMTEQRRYGMVVGAYVVGLGLTLLGAMSPGVLYGPLAMTRGPLFWPSIALAIVAATLPLVKLAQAYRVASAERRPQLRSLGVAGVLCYAGGLGNALLISSGRPLPIGMYAVLGSLLVLTNVVRAQQAPSEQRLLDRSLLYSALAAFLSAGFLFGVMTLMSSTTERFLTQYKLGALFLLCLAALAFEPLRAQIQSYLGKWLLKDRADASDLARALVVQEERADQAGRLAELGTFASAVAHEVRNPLGVLGAHLKSLEKSGADAETLSAMREQIDRASHFVDELLRYGRPRPLELRMVDLGATADLAVSTARQGLGAAGPSEVQVQRAFPPEGPLVEADQAQLSQLLVILVENALLALDGKAGATLRIGGEVAAGRAHVVVEDSGAGLAAELLPRLFQPFVTGRKREGPKRGTGLGLAIARGIAERHGGSLRAGASTLGGAKFELELPRVQAVLAAAAASGSVT